MRSVEVTAKTRKEAIDKALQELGVELHEVSIEILDEGSKGLFGLGARDVKVRVAAEGLSEGLPEGRGSEATALLKEVIGLMGMEATVTSQRIEDEGLRLNIESPDSAILIGRKGRNLNAMQYLINRMVPSGDGLEDPERIIVDVEGYLGRRRASLEEMARSMARRAKETRRHIRVKPLNPQERRIIHLALEDDPDIRTFSLGDSLYRSVVIAPKDAIERDSYPARPQRSGPGRRYRGSRGYSGPRRSGPATGPAQRGRGPAGASQEP